MKNKRYLALIISLFLFIRLVGLGADISNTDAYRWHRRSQSFLAAVKSGDFKGTYQHYQPGVTLMWINSFVKQAVFTTQYRLLGNEHPKTLENSDWYPVIHGISKAVLVFILALVLLLQLKLLVKIFNMETALFYGFFISVEPYLIGMDRWFHLTSLETYFGFTSFLFLTYWYKKPGDKRLIFSGLFFALSVLSKITTLLTLPLYLLLITYKHVHTYTRATSLLKNITTFLFSAIIPIFILFPALVTDSTYVVGQIFSAGKNAVYLGNRAGGLSAIMRILFYDFVVLFKLSPIVLALFIVSFLKLKKVFCNRYVIITLLYLLFYYVVLTLSQMKIDRYITAMFPPVILIGSIFLETQKANIKKAVVGLSAAYIVVVSYVYCPVYSAYYSPLFGGTGAAINLGIYDNSGEYFAQAAEHLNTKGRDVKVFVPNGEASFDYYFKGERSNALEELPDYVVVSYDSDRGFINNHGCSNYESSFGSREMDVVYVFKCK